MSKATEPSAEEDIVASGEALRTVRRLAARSACTRTRPAAPRSVLPLDIFACLRMFLHQLPLADAARAVSACAAKPTPLPPPSRPQVAGWLGVGDVDNVLEKEGLNPEFEMGRQQGLGLGAKFLPHHKVRQGWASTRQTAVAPALLPQARAIFPTCPLALHCRLACFTDVPCRRLR